MTSLSKFMSCSPHGFTRFQILTKFDNNFLDRKQVRKMWNSFFVKVCGNHVLNSFKKDSKVI